MSDYFTQYKKQGEPERAKKAENWEIAVGLQQVDDLTPSKYLIEIAKDNIEGKISIDEASKQISRYYQENPAKNTTEENEKEADEVSARIAKLLSNSAFSFSPAEYISIHQYLFSGILSKEVAGKVRTFNITKKEPILNGDSVIYGNSSSIRETLDYDFATEKNFKYQGLSKQEKIEHLAKFISGIWQIHPFAEGNTRTTAVFTIKYLATLGFTTNNDLFAKYAKYFRNALVRANYQNLDKDIYYNMEYLHKFFSNLLLEEKHLLSNREMQIKQNSATQKKEEKTTQNTTQKILTILSDNPRTTRAGLAKMLGLTPEGIKWNLTKLKKAGKIKRIGADNGGYWQVTNT